MPSLRHHTLATTADVYDIEVWADGHPGTVTLYASAANKDTVYAELTPSEARALAALLIVAADQQQPFFSSPA